MPLLEVKNLHVEIDAKKILNGLDLTIEKGKVHAIMAPNGSGKSTLAYVLAGKTDYQLTAGECCSTARISMQPDERAARGVFLAFQYPMEIPGVAVRAGTHASCRRSRATASRLPAARPSLFTTRRMRSIRWPSPWSRHGSFSHE